MDPDMISCVILSIHVDKKIILSHTIYRSTRVSARHESKKIQSSSCFNSSLEPWPLRQPRGHPGEPGDHAGLRQDGPRRVRVHRRRPDDLVQADGGPGWQAGGRQRRHQCHVRVESPCDQRFYEIQARCFFLNCGNC